MDVLCLVPYSCLTLCNPMACTLPGPSVHGDSPGKNTGVHCHVLLQGIFPTQGWNPGFPHCGRILYHLSHQGSPNWCIGSVQFSHSVVSSSLWPHGRQHARPPCPSPTPRVHPNPCPLSRWCHPTISSSVVHFSSCPQSIQASGSSQMSQFFASGGQSTEVSAPASVLPMNIQDWSPLGWIDWISLQVQGTLKSLLQHHSSKASILQHSVFFRVQLSHPYMTTGKTIALIVCPN